LVTNDLKRGDDERNIGTVTDMQKPDFIVTKGMLGGVKGMDRMVQGGCSIVFFDDSIRDCNRARARARARV